MNDGSSNKNNEIEQFSMAGDEGKSSHLAKRQVASSIQPSPVTLKEDVSNSLPSVGAAPVKMSSNTSMQREIVTPSSTGAQVENVNSKKKKTIALIILLMILIIAGAGVFVIKYITDNPLNLFKSAIDLGYENVSKALDTAEKYSLTYDKNESFKMSTDIKLDSKEPSLNEYTKYSYKLNLGTDLANGKMEMGLSLNEGDKKIVEGLLYGIGDTFYLKSEQLYDKMLFSKSTTSLSDISDTSSIDISNIYSDADVLAKKVSEYAKSILKETDFTKESTFIKINSKDTKVTKTTYKMDKDAVFNLYVTIINGFKNDDEVLSILSRISGVDKKTIVNALNEIDLNNNPFKNFSGLNISIYTKGWLNKVVGFSISEKGIDLLNYVTEKSKSELVIMLSPLRIEANSENGVTTGKVLWDDTEVLTFKLNEVMDDNTVKYDMEFDYTEGDTSVIVNLNTYLMLESETKENIDIGFKVSISNGEESYTLSSNITSSMEVGGTITDVNTSGAVDAEKINEEEWDKIYNNLATSLENTPFYELLGFDTVMKDAFAIDAESLVSASEVYTANESMLGNVIPAEKCIDITELVNLGYSTIDTSKYDGKVVIKNENGEYSYAIYMTDKKYMLNGITVDDYSFGIQSYDVEKYMKEQINLECDRN